MFCATREVREEREMLEDHVGAAPVRRIGERAIAADQDVAVVGLLEAADDA